MVLPIVAYGHPVLRKVCDDITAEYPELKKLIADMWESMYPVSYTHLDVYKRQFRVWPETRGRKWRFGADCDAEGQLRDWRCREVGPR